jgi:CMP-N-acetylneuraminic acid synthetase
MSSYKQYLSMLTSEVAKMQCVILIPARAGSKRIHSKNIKELGGVPLVVWSILIGRELGLPTYVSTDSRVCGEIATSYGAEVIHRPAEFCTDSATDYDVVAHFLGQVAAGLVVYLRPTTPFRAAHVVQDAIRLMSVPGYDSLRSVEPMAESAFKCFRIKNGILRPLTKGVDLTDRPNQELEQTFHPNGYVDIARMEIVERGAKSRSLWGAGRVAFMTARTVEIDTPEDWEYAEWYATNKMRRWESEKTTD